MKHSNYPSLLPFKNQISATSCYTFLTLQAATFSVKKKSCVCISEDSVEESFDEDAYYEKLGTRPALDAEALGSSYRRMVELFYLCTEEDPKKRPSASQIIQALESNALLDKTPSEVIVID